MMSKRIHGKRIGLIGNFCGDIIGGQAEKTRVLYDALELQFVYVFKADIFGLNPLKMFLLICKTLWKCDQIIVILASPGYFKLQPFLVLCNRILHKQLFEFVIGGIRHQYLQGKRNRICREQKIKRIYLESPHMVCEYQKLGLNNTIYIPNFKTIDKMFEVNKIDLDELKTRIQSEGLHLCTFSRIDKYKGIDTAIDVANAANKKGGIKVELNIIGPIDEEYKADFHRILTGEDEKRIHYLGSIPSKEAVTVLSKYDILLFPTHWKAEGFPGSFIDAMAAGLPILASDKENFRDIVKNGYNGWLLDEWNVDGFVEKITELTLNPELLIQMRRNAVNEAKNFNVENALSKVMKDLKDD